MTPKREREIRELWREVESRALPYLLRGEPYIKPVVPRIEVVTGTLPEATSLEYERFVFSADLKSAPWEHALHYQVQCEGLILQRGAEPLNGWWKVSGRDS